VEEDTIKKDKKNGKDAKKEGGKGKKNEV